MNKNKGKESILSYMFDLLVRIPATVGMLFIPLLAIILEIKSYIDNVASLFPTIIVTWSCIAVYIYGSILLIKKLRKDKKSKNERKNR